MADPRTGPAACVRASSSIWLICAAARLLSSDFWRGSSPRPGGRPRPRPAPAPPPALQPALKMVQWLQTKVSRHTVQRLLANTHHVGFTQSSYTVEHQQIRQGMSVKFRYVIDCKRCLSFCLYILHSKHIDDRASIS